MISIIIGGWVAGLGHVFSGPDHLAAVAPLAVADRKAAWKAGLRWGLGHTGGVLLVGVLLVLLKQMVHVEALSAWSEYLVGVMLMLIGVWGFWSAWRKRLHVHPHVHGGDAHAHLHVHGRGAAHGGAPSAPPAHQHGHAAIAVGTLHGLAGSSHILGIVPALGFATMAESCAYLAAFGVGTVMAMILFAATLGMISKGFSAKGARFYQGLMYVCSAAAIAVGVWWLLQASVAPAH